MILQGRNLQQGLSGPDVAQLQKGLSQLSYTIPAAELSASTFGSGTLAAVQQFQTAHELPSTGIVDAGTAAALSALIQANTYTVQGTVTSAVSAGVAGLTVLLVDKTLAAMSPSTLRKPMPPAISASARIFPQTV